MPSVRPNIAEMTGLRPRRAAARAVEKFIKLNTNENPYQCSPKVKAAIGRVVQPGLQKYPDPLATAFRIRAGELLGVDPDWILCGNGSDDILTIVTRAFVGTSDMVRFANPSYLLYRTLAEIQGAACDIINYNADWSLPDEFAQAERLDAAGVSGKSEQPVGHDGAAGKGGRARRRPALPAAGRRGVRRFRRHELPVARGRERKDHGRPHAEQVVRAGRAAVRLPGRPAASDSRACAR